MATVLVCSTLTNNSHAQKVYKIVDEEIGKATYSQVPPKKKKEGVRVEGMNVDHGGSTALVVRGGKPYCGTMRLYVASKTTLLREPERYRSRLQSRRDRWLNMRRNVAQTLESGDQAQNKRSNSDYSRYETDSNRNARYNNYEKNKARNAKQLRDLNCAVEWAEKELARIDGMDTLYDAPTKPGADTQELERLASLIKQHETRKIRSCGPEPVFDPTTAQGKAKTKSWQLCTKNYNNEIRKLERRMYKVEREGYRR